MLPPTRCDSLPASRGLSSVAMPTLFETLGLLVAVISAVSPQMLPDSHGHTLDELEHLYLDNTGPVGFKSGITPCTLYIDSTTGRPDNTLGRQAAAEWIRTAFRKTTLL